METFHRILDTMPWYGWVGIVAILAGTTSSIIRASYRHTERMAKIKQGMDPDRKNGPP